MAEPSRLVEIITSPDAGTRNTSLHRVCTGASSVTLLAECEALDQFRRRCDNLYQRVRALFFLYAIHRFHLPQCPEILTRGHVSVEGTSYLLNRCFADAIDVFLAQQRTVGQASLAVSSSLATAYRHLGFQTLADQVRRSVRSVNGNQWMFRCTDAAGHPLRLRRELLPQGAVAPVLCERTPVRMDLSHSAWSDIFFLGMDYPEGARVLNVSVDLGVRGRDEKPAPPIEVAIRVIDRPCLRLVSVDLGACAELYEVAEVFDFARDYLGLLKAAVVAAGIVPPGLEGSGQRLPGLLRRIIGPGFGLELVSYVRDIPKGSRLAVSTNLLASLIAVSMRATGQTQALSGPLSESERRLVAARAILGEWLGGSGGGWQDSGGVWPGIKLIQGVPASAGDPEAGISRGRLLPSHTLLGDEAAPPALREGLERSLVLVHGGMAQNVGPILEMVTEKYLLRADPEWQARRRAGQIFEDMLAAFRQADVRRVAELTMANFTGPLQEIIPWATNHYTETLIEQVRRQFGDTFWGFWMLGGMSGGGMGFVFDPAARSEASDRLTGIMRDTRRALETGLPFAMEPVVYDFAINDRGTVAECLRGEAAWLPAPYYRHAVPDLLRKDPRTLSRFQRHELARFGRLSREEGPWRATAQQVLDAMFPSVDDEGAATRGLRDLLDRHGFDPVQHEQVRSDLAQGHIGLAHNRLPLSTVVDDAGDQDFVTHASLTAYESAGQEALRSGRLAVVTLAAGAGSRWTQGAGVVKGLHPFCRFSGRHRTFLEIHLAKSRRTGRRCGTALTHIFTTGYLTHGPIDAWLRSQAVQTGPQVCLSPGRAVGLRMVPTVRDLRYAWEESAQQALDERAQKVRESLQAALIGWAQEQGEATDYTDNDPLQCLHPVGHWYEIPNLLRNGVLADLLDREPHVDTLLVHNIDTLGVGVDMALLGWFLASGHSMAFEVVPRQSDDVGGGLARVGGHLRLVEGMALPRESDEFRLSCYNSMTTWLRVGRLLDLFGLSREDLRNEPRVTEAIRALGAKMPTYVTLKDVKKRWGHGHEDVFPVAQFEKLWGDMTTLPENNCGFVLVSRARGQQLKDPAQLDGWVRDGSADYLEALCDWGEAGADE